MPPFNSSKVQAQSEFASKSDMHRSKDKREGMQMEVDLVIALKLHLTEFEVTSNTINIFGTTDLSNDAQGSIFVQDHAFVGVITLFDVITAPIIFNVTIKDDNKVHIVGTGMNVEASISIRPKLATILVDIAPNTSTTPEDVRINVMIQIVDVKKANVMEK